MESPLQTVPDSLKASFVGVAPAASVFWPCTHALALVESSQASKCETVDWGRFRVVTHGVMQLQYDSLQQRWCAIWFTGLVIILSCWMQCRMISVRFRQNLNPARFLHTLYWRQCLTSSNLLQAIIRILAGTIFESLFDSSLV